MDASLAIRHVIYKHFNDPDLTFTNDQVLDIMIKDDMVEAACSVDDVEDDFQNLCRTGVVRNIAQNFTTMYLKLFTPLQLVQCKECGQIPLHSEEPRVCIICGVSVTQ